METTFLIMSRLSANSSLAVLIAIINQISEANNYNGKCDS